MLDPKRVPNGRSEVDKLFGDPSHRGWEGENLVVITLPYRMRYRETAKKPWSIVTTMRCHDLVQGNFLGAFNEVAAYARREVKKVHGYDLTTQQYNSLVLEWLGARHLDEFSGAYNYRPIRNSSGLSMHSYGIAIDLADEHYPQKSQARLPEWFIAIFEKYGFFYGGDFKTTKDPMHFQWARGV